MFSIDLDEKHQKDLEELFRTMPQVAEKILNKSLKKVMTYVKEIEKKHMQKKYTPESDLLSGAKAFKIRAKNGEAEIHLATKRNKMTSFDISSKTPVHSKPGKFIKVAITRGNTTEMSTMFWGFYKKKGKRFGLGLYKRNRTSTNKHITPIRTVSLFQMSYIPTKEDEEKMKEIFRNDLMNEMRYLTNEK